MKKGKTNATAILPRYDYQLEVSADLALTTAAD